MKKFVQKWSLPLRWWLLFSLIAIGSIIFVLSGGFAAIYLIDFTRISFLIYFIFYIFSIRTGFLSYKLSKSKFLTADDINNYNHKNELGWFISDQLFTLGMIGTVFGFIYMLSTAFGGLTTFSVAAIQAALLKMSNGMSTALYTTASGLVCSLLLKLQLFDLQQHLDKLARKLGLGDNNNEK